MDSLPVKIISQNEHQYTVKPKPMGFWTVARIAVCGLLTVIAIITTFCTFKQQYYVQDFATPASSTLTKRATAATATTTLLRDFQVMPPVLTPFEDGIAVLTDGSAIDVTTSVNVGEKGCVKQVVLMEHVFAYSYGVPFIGKCMKD